MLIDKDFTFVKRDASNAQKKTQLLTTQRQIQGRQVHVRRYLFNYKSCTVYTKNVQKSYFPTLRKKMISPES
jgi:hypothetical protein